MTYLANLLAKGVGILRFDRPSCRKMVSPSSGIACIEVLCVLMKAFTTLCMAMGYSQTAAHGLARLNKSVHCLGGGQKQCKPVSADCCSPSAPTAPGHRVLMQCPQ